MGYFSYTCAKTGLPIMAGELANDPEEKALAKATILLPNGDKMSGLYDGYGHLGHLDIGDLVEIEGAKMVLSCFHRGETYEQLGRSEWDPGQGAHHDWDLIKSAHSIINNGMQNIYDAHVLERGKWDKCHQEHEALAELMGEEFKKMFGVPVYAIQDMMADMRSDLGLEPDATPRWKLQWDREIAPHWEDVPETSPLKTLPAVAAIHALDGVAKFVKDMARTESLRAWLDDDVARAPNFDVLLTNPQSPEAWSNESAIEQEKRIKRPTLSFRS